MADSITAGHNSGDEAAQWAAAEARRREITEKICQLELEKAKCQGIKIALRGMKERLEGVIFQMDRLKDKKLEVDILRFSGATADAVDTGILNAQSVMSKRNGSFSDLELMVDTQISLLESYIVELGGRINALKASI